MKNLDMPCERFKAKREDALCESCGWGHCYHPIECRGPSAPVPPPKHAPGRDGPLREEMRALFRILP